MNLPIYSHEKQLETKSIDRLRILFHQEFHPKYKFLVSSDKGYDYGVDCNLELIIDKYTTNFNCHVQLKAIDKLERKAKLKNGSYSIKIKTSNVNYLMNTPKSLYILFVNSENQFYYEWADEFFLKLRKEDENWDSKSGKKTLNFKNKIDDNALLHIFNKVWERGKTGREVDEKLVYFRDLIEPKSPNIIINADNLEVKSENEIIDFIEKYGGYYLNQREENILVEKSDKITPEYLVKRPLACLILGIANFNVGHTYKALDLINRAKGNRDELDKYNRATLKFYEANISYLIGVINNDQLEIKLRQIKHEPHQLHLEFLKILQEFRKPISNIEERLTAISETRDFAKKMEKFSEKYPKIYIQTQIELLRVEGWLVAYKQRFKEAEIQEQISKLYVLANKIDPHIKKYGDEILMAIFREAFISIMVNDLFFKYKNTKEPQVFHHFCKDLDTIIRIFRKHHYNWNQCVSTFTKFKLHKYFEFENEAKEVRIELLEITDNFGFTDIEYEVAQFEELLEK